MIEFEKGEARIQIYAPQDILDQAQEALGPQWKRKADKPRLIAFLTKRRFSYLDLIPIAIIAAILRQLI